MKFSWQLFMKFWSIFAQAFHAFTNFATHFVQKDIVYHQKQIDSGIFIYLCMQGKVFPVHALKMWGSGGIAACVLNLGTNWS